MNDNCVCFKCFHLSHTIFLGQSPYVVLWCRFFNDSSRDMEARTDLQFDPATAFHTYKIVYTVIKESLLV